ncbi:non-hydrolyzing UDP-N-acetylglucosamine 2-epimerase [Brevundimonas sp. Leaf168]|uniref:non-hydrolyzing UDP-N-acetylglucosamine 2-epimerase n=1 Tax=Brevundimonas sp. Leaf168 TaxID=1736283 RepID=UPI0006F75463|nr:UDP-N-acetylglucosamine 2-epimerase (non-hydrolyzing) [Brevundimonas sp. Leaf168]KQR56232.1 UDP-N-acetyl glucosamine 2-epimerase [Brevundimonas sp. Leaf168]
MRIAVIFGTRPEAIKMAPVIRALQANPSFECLVWSTGQHRQMLDQVLSLFSLRVDEDLGLMRPDQTLNELFSSAVLGVDRVLKENQPDLLLVHGDTSTAAAAATAAFHRKVAIGHVEAGLRSGRLDQPWPEEFNRRVTDMVSDHLFAPTEGARRNLLAESVPADKVHVTGNTVIDALLQVQERLLANPVRAAELAARFDMIEDDRPLVLVTGHRRENFGEGFRGICSAIKRLSNSDVAQVIFPVHLNPHVQGPVREMLADCRGVHLIDPVNYEEFVYLMGRSSVILTDSGGVQEEAPSLNKPVLVTRDVTERPEAVEAGVAELVGTNPDRIYEGVLAALIRPAMNVTNPYGDGGASQRIVEKLINVADRLR